MSARCSVSVGVVTDFSFQGVFKKKIPLSPSPGGLPGGLPGGIFFSTRDKNMELISQSTRQTLLYESPFTQTRVPVITPPSHNAIGAP